MQSPVILNMWAAQSPTDYQQSLLLVGADERLVVGVFHSRDLPIAEAIARQHYELMVARRLLDAIGKLHEAMPADLAERLRELLEIEREATARVGDLVAARNAPDEEAV